MKPAPNSLHPCDEELEKEMKKALAMAKDPETAAKIAGSYGTEKAKIMGQVLRMVNQELERTRSLLIIVQQIRQNLNASPFSSPWRTSGGEAPFFYSQHQVWLNKTGTIKSRGRKIGTQVKADVKKNKLNGKLRAVEFDIFYDLGIDDIGSMVDFMLAEGFWKKKGQTVYAEGLGIEGTRPVLFMDEPLKWLKGGQLPERGASMIKEISEKLGLQVVMISHIPDQIEGSDRRISVALDNGVSRTSIQ